MMHHVGQPTGTNAKVINFFILFIAIFLAIVGIGSAVLIAYEIGNQQPINPLISGIIVAMIVSATTIISVTHNSQTINGTAAQAASQTAENLLPAIEQANRTSATNAETIQQMLHAMMEQQEKLQRANIDQAAAVPIAAVLAEKASSDAVRAAGLAGIQSIQALPVVTLAPDIAALATDEGAIAHTMEKVQPGMIEQHEEEKKDEKQAKKK